LRAHARLKSGAPFRARFSTQNTKDSIHEGHEGDHEEVIGAPSLERRTLVRHGFFSKRYVLIGTIEDTAGNNGTDSLHNAIGAS
ncbi:MAG TPA: hypothetical protein PLO55_06560, partial [Thermotogota bacterium]|nr:hypothetical protein [Thermotogota bacterium]